jgi:sodium-coupled neutral amino acid transporter 10
VELSIIGFLMGTCIAFFVVIGDLCPILVIRLFNLKNVDHDSLRFWLIIFTTIIFIIPLSLQKNLQSLTFVCKASIAFYICLTIKTVLESFSRFQSDGNWLSHISLWNSENLLQCLPIFSMAMSCQMQLFEIYENITSFDRIRQNIFHATSICLVVYSIIGFFGYAAFYNQTLSGNILVNFSPSIANNIITLGFILSIACSFPLVIFPCRTSLSSLIYRRVHHSDISPYVPESRYKPLTIFIIVLTMIFGILIPSVEVIIGFVGSTIGTLICIIFPATTFVKIMQRNTTEKLFAQLLIVVGFVIMILGTYSNLTALDNAGSGSHLEIKLPATVKPNEALPILHPNDIAKIQNDIPPLAKDLPIVQKNQTEDKKREKVNAKPVEEVVKISDDGIKKEEQEIAAASEKIEKPDSKDPQQEIKEKDNEIKELKASKDKLEQEVIEMKQVLVKQNQETQQLVLQKFEEIAEKVDKIEKQSLDSVPSKDRDIDDGEKKAVADAASKEVINEKKLEIPQAPVITNPAKVDPPKTNATLDHKSDPIVKLIKSQEPLSYQVGEKMVDEKVKKENLTLVVEKLKEPEKSDVNVKQEGIKSDAENLKKNIDENVSHEDFKNEMRKKRATSDFLDETLSKINPLTLQFKTLVSRDLKAVDDDKEM